MRTDIPHQIAVLHALSRPQLLDCWRVLYERAAPDGIRRELMIPFLAYRIQEKSYGGLKPSTRSELRRIARNLENSTGSSRIRNWPRLRTGTRLLRHWRGETHEVLVSDSTYEYRGTGYRSLSEIARRITGTRWSGPAFFRLNGVKTASEKRG